MKSQRQYIKLYREIYNEADKLFKQYNPCDVQNGKCLAFRLKYYSTNFCCDNCKYISKNGCTVKSIFCKLWICNAIIDNASQEFKSKLEKLRLYAANHCINGYYYSVFRGSQKENIQKFNIRKQALINKY